MRNLSMFSLYKCRFKKYNLELLATKVLHYVNYLSLSRTKGRHKNARYNPNSGEFKKVWVNLGVIRCIYFLRKQLPQKIF